MAKFNAIIPNDLIKYFDELETNCEDIFGEMCKAGANKVYNKVMSNMKNKFKTTKSLEQGLKITKVYKAPSKDTINVYVGFYGYVKGSKKTARHPYGTPIPLIAMAREYGTYGSNPSSNSNKKTKGEKKEPFFYKSFNKNEIEQEMLKVQDKYIKGD